LENGQALDKAIKQSQTITDFVNKDAKDVIDDKELFPNKEGSNKLVSDENLIGMYP
jgi:hypothetical protein